jgi:mRNA interferase MazF
VIGRGEIWWATLPDPAGSEPGYRRPVVIVQADEFNHSRINTVLAVLLTSNLPLAAAPGNLLLPARATGLTKNSVANVSQVLTVDKSFLTERVGKLTPALMNEVAAGLRLVMDL